MPRGGKRPGSGRPAPDGRRVAIAARVTPETARKLKEITGRTGESLGKTIDSIVKDYGGE
jgi:hypothetical protein